MTFIAPNNHIAAGYKMSYFLPHPCILEYWGGFAMLTYIGV